MMYIRKNYNPKTIHARRTMAVSALAGPITVLIVVAIHMAGPLQATPLPTDSNRFGIDFKRYCNHHLSEMLVRVCDPNYRKGFSRESNRLTNPSLGSYSEGNANNPNNLAVFETINDCCREACDYAQLTLLCPSMKFSQIIISSRVLSVTTTTLVVIGFIVIISLPSPANTQPLAANSRDVPHQRYCSLSLFEAIRAICKGRYNSLSNVYPESFGNQNRASLLRRLIPSDDDVNYRPSFGGPVHECCRRPCGYTELQAYCAE